MVADLSAVEPRALASVERLMDALARGRLPLPVLPAVAMELFELASDADIPFERLARRAVTDPNVAARIMALASSCAFGVNRPTGVKDALARIGLDGVRHVAFDIAYSARVLRRGPHLPLVERAVRHARTASALCRLLARDVGIAPGPAALAGLLHALGAIVIIDDLSKARPPVTGRAAILAVRRLHGWTAARVAARHQVDPDVVDALDEHHLPTSRTPLSALLQLADLISPSEPGGRAIPLGDALARTGLPLAERAVRERLSPLLATFEESRRVLLPAS